MTSSVKVLELEQLVTKNIPGIGSIRGAAHAEACMVCLSTEDHAPGVSMKIAGGLSADNFIIRWDSTVTPQIQRAWADPQEALENGAAGLAILTLLELTPYTVVERSYKNSGVDYWLSETDDTILFQYAARLEVSGIQRSNPKNSVERRVQVKKKQTEPSDQTGLPAYVAVVEFSEPLSHLELKT